MDGAWGQRGWGRSWVGFQRGARDRESGARWQRELPGPRRALLVTVWVCTGLGVATLFPFLLHPTDLASFCPHGGHVLQHHKVSGSVIRSVLEVQVSAWHRGFSCCPPPSFSLSLSRAGHADGAPRVWG